MCYAETCLSKVVSCVLNVQVGKELRVLTQKMFLASSVYCLLRLYFQVREKIFIGVIFKVRICHLCSGVLARNVGSLKNISS